MCLLSPFFFLNAMIYLRQGRRKIMLKKAKNFLVVLVLSIGIFNMFSLNVSAAEINNADEEAFITLDNEKNDGMTDFVKVSNYNVTDYSVVDNFESGISVYSTSKPSKVWNLSTQGRYNFVGDSIYHVLYTGYKFTGASKVRIVINIEDGVDEFEGFTGIVDFYKDALIDVKIKSWTCPADDVTIAVISNISASSKYYIRFRNPIVFNGYIEKA